MSARRTILAPVLAGLTFAALVLAGCAGVRDDGGEGSAAGQPPAADEVRLVVSRGFGTQIMRDVLAPADEGLDVLRLLAEHADVEAGYGGRFVNGIDGLASTFGAAGSDDAADWFYWVDGEMADVGADERKLKGGETVWWDYHPWADAMYVPQALHAFPRPYTGAPQALTADAEVTGLVDWAKASGIELDARRELAGERPRGGVVAATAGEAAATPWLVELLGPERSGLEMVRVDGGTITLLAPDGSAGPQAAAAALPAPNQDDPSRPFLILLGASGMDLEDLLSRLSADALNARVGVALVDDRLVALPWTQG
jgi:hypothetical protein